MQQRRITAQMALKMFRFRKWARAKSFLSSCNRARRPESTSAEIAWTSFFPPQTESLYSIRQILLEIAHGTQLDRCRQTQLPLAYERSAAEMDRLDRAIRAKHIRQRTPTKE